MRIKPGDIFEIKTPQGKVYLHYIYIDEFTGELIRVLPGFYQSLPKELSKLVSQKEQFVVSFPLTTAFNKKFVKLVGFSSEGYTKPKHMRSEHIIKGQILGWHIIDTDTWQRQLVKNLSQEQIQLSPWGIWNDTLLIENLVKGWTLQKWV